MTDIGQFMFGVGAIIQHPTEDKVLILRRSSQHVDFQQGQWDFIYGRKAQFEEVKDGLMREVEEETGITDLKIGTPLRVWHFYRGEKLADTEILGITFLCQTQQTVPNLNDEHNAYKWVTYAEARNLISIKGVLLDIDLAEAYAHGKEIALTGTDEILHGGFAPSALST